MGKFTEQPWLGRGAATGVFCKGYVERKGLELAPQSGHVSNFCGPVGTLIELRTSLVFRMIGGKSRFLSMLGTQLGFISNLNFWRMPKVGGRKSDGLGVEVTRLGFTGVKPC